MTLIDINGIRIATGAGGIFLSLKDAFEFQITRVSERSRLHEGSKLVLDFSWRHEMLG